MNRNQFFIAKLALGSRICLFMLQAVFNLLPDHKADAFDPGITDNGEGYLDTFVSFLFDGFHKWDAKYFVYLAKYGYEEERMFAFFPLYPGLLRMLSTLLEVSPLQLSTHSRVLLSGAILNAACFAGAAVALYDLTLKIYQSQKFAFWSALLFSFNPASIFFSANYTEALYCFCVFQGLLQLENRQTLLSGIYFMGASSTRSNGIVNAGFPVYFALKELIQLGSLSKHKLQAFKLFSQTSVTCIAIFLPFISFNMYGYYKFCTPDGSSPQEWCDATLPLIYNHVQKAHWDVGFMKYYKIRKLPNFFLVTPCVVLSSFGMYYYLRKNWEEIPNLGLFKPRTNVRISQNSRSLPFSTLNIFVYIVHLLVLFLFGVLFMHIEVVTRFLFSSTPVLTWVASSLLFVDIGEADVHLTQFSDMAKVWSALSQRSKILCCYFVTYFVIGTLLHVNYLPWT